MSQSHAQILIDLCRGTEGVYSQDDLKSKLASGRRLRIKLGMDPTSADLHLGHTVVLRKMRQFQDAGHIGVLIIGDYTARIGDPTGRDKTRPILNEAAITQNAATYLEQAGKILDRSPDKLEVRRNSEWLGKLNFADVLKLSGLFTVQQMLHRDMFDERLKAGREIMISEFMYPLMQGYDSVVVRADVELGGTDQTFNNLVGRDMMARHDLERQVVITMPILAGLDGKEKMSKSKGNAVGITFSPDDMYGKLMSIPDQLMPNYFQLLTDLPAERISSLLDSKATHPRDAKDALARVIVEEFHSSEAANAASTEFRRRFSEKQLPTDMEVKRVAKSPISIIELVRAADFAPSNGEARRLVEQGAVTFAGNIIKDPKTTVEIAGDAVLQVGKRRVCRIELTG